MKQIIESSSQRNHANSGSYKKVREYTRINIEQILFYRINIINEKNVQISTAMLFFYAGECTTTHAKRRPVARTAFSPEINRRILPDGEQEQFTLEPPARFCQRELLGLLLFRELPKPREPVPAVQPRRPEQLRFVLPKVHRTHRRWSPAWVCVSL